MTRFFAFAAFGLFAFISSCGGGSSPPAASTNLHLSLPSLPRYTAPPAAVTVTLPTTVPGSHSAATISYIPLTTTNTNAVNPCLGNNKPTACTTYVSYPYILNGLVSLASVHSDYAIAYSIGVTYEGRMISAIKISDNPGMDENEAVVLIVGGYHSREWLAINFTYLLMEYLLANKNTPAVRWHLDNSEIWIVPLLNADGRIYDESGNSPPNYWRKNRRPLIDSGGDTVAFGVDLNRNHSFLWGAASQTMTTRWGVSATLTQNGSSSDFNNETYRGTGPTSEPETKALCGLAHSIYPDVGVSYHAYGNALLHSWGYTTGRAAAPQNEYSVAMSIAVEASVQISAVHSRTYGVGAVPSLFYVVNGDFTDWMFGVFGTYSYTPELSSGFYPPTSEIITIFEENIPAALHFIRSAILHDRAITPLLTQQQDCGFSGSRQIKRIQ